MSIKIKVSVLLCFQDKLAMHVVADRLMCKNVCEAFSDVVEGRNPSLFPVDGCSFYAVSC